MAELDKIPQKQQIEIATVKLDDDIIETINDYQAKSNLLVNDFGSIYIRKKEIQDELLRLDEILEKAEDDFKSIQFQLKEVVEGLDDKYPQGRINIQDGTIQYQPGAPTRKQMQEEQQQQLMKQASQTQNPNQMGSGMKVVKE
jgi:hypothetical protein